ncbi:glycosyltransferase [Kordia jejudonensis]|uniref:glycosyltransferase n=1 Tax=Kordia jejudonensis TaxID=1348245 RepID=UPI000629113B|nr:glycosyltransferase [Kordia jejudonensis]
MNILFLVNNTKISPNANGGASVYFSHLELLHKAGFTVHLLFLDWNHDNTKAVISENINQDFVDEISEFYNSAAVLHVAYEVPKLSMNHLLNAVIHPEKFEYHFINAQNEVLLQNYCAQKQIDLMWAEWRWSVLLAAYTSIDIPKIYAHHDWEYKLGKLRKQQKGLKYKFHLYQKKRVEMDVIQKVEACVSGSFTETEELKAFGATKSMYIPLTYSKTDITENDAKVPTIVHVGGMGTTANRIGLERFLEVCWETIKQQIPHVKLNVIGSLKYASDSLQRRLEDPQINCLGFVKNLAPELKAYDIHIIPWEYNTGTRTRIPLVFNHAQVLVSTKAAASCYPELMHDENCILSNDLQHMTTQIIDLYNNAEKRIFTGDNARKTFLENFTTNTQIEKLKLFLNEI